MDLPLIFSSRNRGPGKIGSGSTAVAAIETGRHYVGIEIEQRYCDLSEGNVEQARREKELSDRQLDLFGR